MQGKLRSVINILDLSVGELEHLMDLADRIEKQPEEYRDRCRYKNCLLYTSDAADEL